MINAVIFDLDGTITQPFFDFDAIRRDIGMAPDAGPILEAMKQMSPQQQRNAEKILHYHENLAVERSTLNPHAAEILNILRKRGLNIGILTRNTRANARAIAEKHNLVFDAIIDRTDGPVKPDPFGVLNLCKQFKTIPAQTLVVGDFLYDMQSAKAAGAIAVLIENHKNSEDFRKYADFTIGSLDEIPAIIDNINASGDV